MTVIYMLRSAIVYIWAFIVIVFCTPYRLLCEHISEKDFEQGHGRLGNFGRRFARQVCALAGAHITVKGLENVPQEGSVLFVGNHQSMFDIPVALAVIPRPVGFIAKEEMRKVPVFRDWIASIGSFFLPRGESRKSLEIIIQASKELKSHTHSLVIFPEGTRSHDGSLGEFKPGSLKIATRSGAAIVPFAVENTIRVMPRGQVWFRPQNVTITFLPAYPAEVTKGHETVSLMDEISGRIAQTLGQAVEAPSADCRGL
jgi:1-acyl-sn-glycerol-3-phosphate acyltransferase